MDSAQHTGLLGKTTALWLTNPASKYTNDADCRGPRVVTPDTGGGVMAHWDSQRGVIVHWDTIPSDNLNWELIDCGCAAGVEWGGDYPLECRRCGGTGRIAKHKSTGVTAFYPGGPFC